MTDDALTALFTLADAYRAALNMSESTLSGLVLKGGNRLRDLRAGKGDIGHRRLQEAIRWFAGNWPDGAVWPDGVERPEPSAPATQPDPDDLAPPKSEPCA